MVMVIEKITNHENHGYYPLVICYIAIENDHLVIVDKSHWKWWIFP